MHLSFNLYLYLYSSNKKPLVKKDESNYNFKRSNEHEPQKWGSVNRPISLN